MKLKNIAFISILSIFISLNSYAKENQEEFIEKNHLGFSLSNFAIKGSYSRDLNKDYELGLNIYYGGIGEYNFSSRSSYLISPDVNFAINLEANLRNYLNRDYPSGTYIKYFLGVPTIKGNYVNSNIDGNSTGFYLGTGLGRKFSNENLAFVLEADLGVHTHIVSNMFGFVFFPRLSIGIENNF
ncbi:MAG: hypothetical protein U0354_03025 [Candidatus Sericytochromatia bacterium]